MPETQAENKDLLLYHDMYNCTGGCPPPDQPDVSYGKNCPNNFNCINGNYGYSHLLAAWNRCRQIPDCGFIMRYGDNKYYLRRISDPNKNGLEGYIFPINCGL